jgi:hypothetical protein
MSLALIIGGVWYYTDGFSFSFAGKLSISIDSATLYAGTIPTSPSCSAAGVAHLIISLSNPTATTAITTITLTGQNVYVVVNSYYMDSTTNKCSQISTSSNPIVPGGQTSLFTVFFASGNSSSSQMTAGLTYSFVIRYSDGQSNLGSAIAH